MRPMAKNDPFIHKPYTLFVLCVLRGTFLQCSHHNKLPQLRIYFTIDYLPHLFRGKDKGLR